MLDKHISWNDHVSSIEYKIKNICLLHFVNPLNENSINPNFSLMIQKR